MFYRFFLILALAIGALALPACKNDPVVSAKVDAARTRNDGPPIWKVTANNQEGGILYLYGAVHILPESIDWQKDDMKAVLTGAGTVFFEAPQDKDALALAAIITARDGYYSGSITLPDQLDGYNQKRLFAATLNMDLPDGSLDHMRPWLAADVLALAALEKDGLTGARGADQTLHALARRAGKHIRYLEDMESHFAASAILSPDVQLQDFIQTLDSLDALPAQTRQLNAAWASGNTAYIEAAITAPLAKAAPDYYAALFTTRNRAWADTLAPFVKTGGNGMAVIGVGHLLGEDSLPQILKVRGLKAERYYAYKGENVIKTIDLD